VLERSVNKISRFVLNKNLINKSVDKPFLNFVYPHHIKDLEVNIKKINWIPDFQEDYLPHLFSKKEVIQRKENQKNIFAKGDVVVLSSEDAEADYLRLYPNTIAKPFVLRFAVNHPDFSKIDITDIKQKYNLPENYFFVPNQFWVHKNHKIILEAVYKLKKKGESIFVVFSGKENDYRNKDYVHSLKSYITKNDITDNVKFLGFLDRKVQLFLMNNSIAVVQPSLFEGWSTVVEDAKALGKYIVLSDIGVHKEQILNGATFFEPKNSEMLANILLSIYSDQSKRNKINHNYNQKVLNFGHKFLELINLESQ